MERSRPPHRAKRRHLLDLPHCHRVPRSSSVGTSMPQVAAAPGIRVAHTSSIRFSRYLPPSTEYPRSWRTERKSVYLTNLVLLLLHGGLALLLGTVPVILVLLAVIVPASIMGVWLFSL